MGICHINFISLLLGYLHVGYAQSFGVNQTEADIPFSTHVYETGQIEFPARAFFQKTKLYSSGKVSAFACVIEASLTVFTWNDRGGVKLELGAKG